MTFVLIASLLPIFPASAISIIDFQYASLVLGQPDFVTFNDVVSRVGMGFPSDVAIDPRTGKVFVSDVEFHRVLRFPSLASLSNGAPAEGVLGAPNFTSAGYVCTASRMWAPYALTVDLDGRLWVVDRGHHRILRFDDASTKPNGSNADGVLGQPNFTSCWPGTTQNRLANPNGITIDSSGTLWIADTDNNRILRFDRAASKPNYANADGVLGQPDFTSRDSATTQNGLSVPGSLEVDDAGHLWVVDTDNSRVLRFDAAALKPNGSNADGVLGQPDFTSGIPSTVPGRLYTPRGLTIDADGRLWVVNNAGDGPILGFNDAVNKPNGAAPDIRFGLPRFNAPPGYAGPTQLSPINVAYDPTSDTLWIADMGNKRVLMFQTLPPPIPASLVLGQPNFIDYTSRLTASGMNAPGGVAIDPTSGKVFVSEYDNNRVLRFASLVALSNNASAEAVFGQPQFFSNTPICSASGLNNPSEIAVDTSGRLWVTDRRNGRVLRFDNASNRTNNATANGVLGQTNFTTCYPRTEHGMSYPEGISIDNAGRLWVADTGNSRVLRFDNAAAKPNGSDADGVLGQADLISAIMATSPNGMRSPKGVFADNTGIVWVADSQNHRILRFDNAAAKPNGADADGVLGQPDFISGHEHVTQDGLYVPFGLTMNRSGKLWVADTMSNRIVWFENAATKPNGAGADGVVGQPNFIASMSGSTSAVGLMSPAQLAYDPVNDVLWSVDKNNNRVLVYGTLPDPSPIPTSTPTSMPTDTPTPTNTPTNTPTETPVPPTATNTPTATSRPTATPTQTPPTGPIVISQVYGGGGNPGATYRNDFVELFNRGTATISLDTWSLQYAASTGLGLFSAHVTPLRGSIAPGQYYLIQLASNGPKGAPLPTPDAVGITLIGATHGKVILANTSIGLACNGASTPCTSAQLTNIVDLVGYGDANFYEGSAAAPSPYAKKSALRLGGGCVDTNNNRADFWLDLVTPRNTLSPYYLCTASTENPSLSTTRKNTQSSGTIHVSTTNHDTTEKTFPRNASASPPAMASARYVKRPLRIVR